MDHAHKIVVMDSLRMTRMVNVILVSVRMVLIVVKSALTERKLSVPNVMMATLQRTMGMDVTSVMINVKHAQEVKKPTANPAKVLLTSKFSTKTLAPQLVVQKPGQSLLSRSVKPALKGALHVKA